MSKTDSTYFRHCEKPTLSPITGTLKGNIPEWLTGTLIRNGPGIQKVGPDDYEHAFDGLAVLHRYHIENGKATYSNRPLESESYRKSMEAKRIVVSEFVTFRYTDPCDTLFGDMKTEFQERMKTDNCLVNVCYYGDQLYAMTETATVRRFDPETLKSIGEGIIIPDYVNIDKASAHPHILENGNVINVGNQYSVEKGAHYGFIEVPPSFNSSETSFKGSRILAEIPAQHPTAPSYFHSFGITKDKLVFVEYPLLFDTKTFLEKKDIAFAGALVWDPKAKTRFYVASIKTGEIHPIVYETDQLFTFHHINAYEEDGHIVVDVSGYDTGLFVTEGLMQGTINKISNSGGSGRRYILPLNIPKKEDGNLITLKNTTATAFVRPGSDAVVDITPQIFHNNWFEFPRINYKYNGKRYRCAYGVSTTKALGIAPAFPEPNTIVKYDFESGETFLWHEKLVITPEPVFVANPTVENAEEDDGVILSPLLHLDDFKKTSLLILDAKTFKEIARVEFNAEGTVTGTFHGQWANTGDKIHLY